MKRSAAGRVGDDFVSMDHLGEKRGPLNTKFAWGEVLLLSIGIKRSMAMAFFAGRVSPYFFRDIKE